MKRLLLLITILCSALMQQASARDEVDSLKHKISICANDTIRAALFSQLAAHYLSYDTIANKREKQIYQENALGYTLDAIQQYSRYHDTIGLRNCYFNLARVYQDQKKFTQAKWFILQSNTLSRLKNDVNNVIKSLLVLASIKADIKDYSLALRDLNEAAALASQNHLARQASAVQLGYASLYDVMGNFAKANIALRKHVEMDDSIRKSDEAKQQALVALADTALSKKKPAISSSKKLYKASASKKTSSL